MLVRKIMSDEVFMALPGDEIASAARQMREKDIGSLVVMEDGKLNGIVTDRDIICRGYVDGLDRSKLTVSDVMSPNVIWCSENEDIEDAIHIMEENKIRRLPVLASDGSITGIVSVGDISSHLSHELAGELIAAVSSPDNPPPTMMSLK